MQPHLDRLSDQDVLHLAQDYDDFAGDERLPASWRGWYANLADLLRVEAARRMIAAASNRDPLGYCWFGRLTPPGPGSDRQPDPAD